MKRLFSFLIILMIMFMSCTTIPDTANESPPIVEETSAYHFDTIEEAFECAVYDPVYRELFIAALKTTGVNAYARYQSGEIPYEEALQIISWVQEWLDLLNYVADPGSSI